MHSLINNCCETHFHVFPMVLRSLIRHQRWSLSGLQVGYPAG